MSHSEYQIVRYYLEAKRAILRAGYGPELVWQSSRRFHEVDETEFLTEAAWVIMSSGLSEHAVRSSFSGVAQAFREFASAAEIYRHRDRCCAEAMTHFAHHGKIQAIATCAQIVHALGYEQFAANLAEDPLAVLRGIPYLGDVTARHLAKNLGVLVCKPDRHLVRTAAALGHSVGGMCELIARSVGDAITVVDVVLWRYALLRRIRVAKTPA
jgi:hypothetical protein